MSANVGNVLHRSAQRDPDGTAVIDSGRNDLALSYAELDRQASRLASQLISRGLGRGDRVAICTENGMEFVAAWFGALYAGCTTLPIAVSSTEHEIAFRLQHASCKALLTDAGHLSVARASKVRANTGSEVLLVEELLQPCEGPTAPCAVTRDSLAMLLYTSGTTGAAKAVCITHGSLVAHTRALVEHALGLGKEDRILGTLPLTHSYGLRTTLLVPFYAGARTIFIPRFSPTRTLELCASHGVTWIPGVPTMFIAWANQTGVPAPRTLRWCMSAGAPLAENVRLHAEERLGAPVRQAYGLTEANLTAINAPPDTAVPGSSGRPVAGVELRIANENGDEVARGVHGEVLIRGQNLMAGYLDDKLATAHVMRGEWLHSGDIGFVDDDGRLTVVDRSKDLILRGGASIYPSEIEAVLTQHGEVESAAVVGQADGYYGEEVVAVVVARNVLNASELDAWARERLAPYKLPRRYAFVKELPVGASGKTLKRVLRDALVSGAIASEPLRPHRPAE